MEYDTCRQFYNDHLRFVDTGVDPAALLHLDRYTSTGRGNRVPLPWKAGREDDPDEVAALARTFANRRAKDFEEADKCLEDIIQAVEDIVAGRHRPLTAVDGSTFWDDRRRLVDLLTANIEWINDRPRDANHWLNDHGARYPCSCPQPPASTLELLDATQRWGYSGKLAESIHGTLEVEVVGLLRSATCVASPIQWAGALAEARTLVKGHAKARTPGDTKAVEDDPAIHALSSLSDETQRFLLLIQPYLNYGTTDRGTFRMKPEQAKLHLEALVQAGLVNKREPAPKRKATRRPYSLNPDGIRIRQVFAEMLGIDLPEEGDRHKGG